jgi:NTP pyrophosphatase (non-canonical NTP hydrolase)
VSGDYSIGSHKWNGLSKLIEECGEVCQVAGKLVGIDGKLNHWDGSNLRKRMQEELGDLLAAINFFTATNQLDSEFIKARSKRKLQRFIEWNKENK